MLSRQVGKQLSVEELSEALFQFGMELDSFEGDSVRVEITPDRPDMLSTQGLARALKGYLGSELGLPEYHVENSEIEVVVDASVEGVRPKTVAAVVRNLELDSEKIREIIWVQEKLHNTFARGRKKAALGIYPLERITPPIRYTARDPSKVKFVPLEATQEMTGWDVLEKHPTGKAFKHLLEGHSAFPFFIDSKNQVLSMPPIVNSHNIGKVTESTRDVFIEVSGHDLKALKQLLNIIVTMFFDMGGQVCNVKMVYPSESFYSPHLKPEKFVLPTRLVNDVLGAKLTFEEVAFYLKKMRHGVISASEKEVEVLVPAYRVDVLHNVDLVDDVGRALGFDKIAPALPSTPTTAAVLRESVLTARRLRDYLKGFKFQDVFTLALTNSKTQFEKMSLPETPCVKLSEAEARAEGINMLRCWMTPELLRVFSSNKHRQFPQQIFEVGYVVLPDGKADSKARNAMKACMLSSHSKASYSEMKSILESVCGAFGLKLAIHSEDKPFCLPGRCARILVNGKEGWLGELHPQVLENFGLENPVAGFEFEV